MSDNHDVTKATAFLTLPHEAELMEGNQCPKCQKFFKTDLVENNKYGKDTCTKCMLDMYFAKVGTIGARGD